METNRILAQKKKQSEESSIKLNTNVPINGVGVGGINMGIIGEDSMI